MKAFSTVITAVNRQGVLEDFEGPPIFAEDREHADSELQRLFPYARVLEEDINMQKLSDKLFNHIED